MKKAKLLTLMCGILVASNLLTYTVVRLSFNRYQADQITNCFHSSRSDSDIVEINSSVKEKGFGCEIINHSACYRLDELIVEIAFSHKSVIDTLKLTTTKSIDPLHSGYILIEEIEVDSVIILNYSIKKVNLFI